jgi:ketosteroid isomerase-like protein
MMKTRAGFALATFAASLGLASSPLVPLAATAKPAPAPAEAAKPAVTYLGEGAEALAQTDIEFSKLSATQGVVKAFSTYLADDAVQLPDNEKPITGKTAICAHLEDYDKRRLILTWRPIRAEVAASGELGYTYGTWTLRAKHRKEIVAVGNYTTVWKKSAAAAADNPWKAVLDIGNQSRQ